MARLPSPGADQGQWGAILNEYLSVEHNADGSLKASGSLAGKYTKPTTGIPESDLASAVQTKLNSAGGTVASANITDATATGRNVLTSTDATAARSAIGAGTSNLAIGATASTAAAGNHTHTKADIGLGNVDNTADTAKPVSTATQTALNAKANTSSLSTVATTGSYTDLSNRPTLSGNNTGDQTLSVSGANLTISGANGNTIVLPSGGPGSAGWGTISGTISDQTDLQAALDSKQVSGSYATTTALTNGLATKLDASQKATASGVASLDANTRVPTGQLGTGTASGTTYLRGDGTWATVSGGTVTAASITDSTTVGRNIITATDAAAVRSTIGAGTSNLALGATASTAAAGNHTHTKADVGLGNVDNTADASKPVSTATQTALDGKVTRAGTGALRLWPASATFPASGMVAGDLFPHIVEV